uniref:Uncharacterized protein n=1 Tax=Aegilops tauschii TaxID=37682 RepID=M8CJ21_AEGTA
MSSKRYKLQFQGNLSQILFRFRAGGEGRTSGCMMETMMHGRTDLESEFFMEYGEINRYQRWFMDLLPLASRTLAGGGS